MVPLHGPFHFWARKSTGFSGLPDIVWNRNGFVVRGSGVILRTRPCEPRTAQLRTIPRPTTTFGQGSHRDRQSVLIAVCIWQIGSSWVDCLPVANRKPFTLRPRQCFLQCRQAPACHFHGVPCRQMYPIAAVQDEALNLGQVDHMRAVATEEVPGREQLRQHAQAFAYHVFESFRTIDQCVAPLSLQVRDALMAEIGQTCAGGNG